jgi:hypothetical protein
LALKNFIKRLERAVRGDYENFELTDGTMFYFNPKDGELFGHTAACLRAGYEGKPYPEPPTTLQALTKARDRAAAADKVATRGLFPYDREALVERGVLVPRSMVAPPSGDLSE